MKRSRKQPAKEKKDLRIFDVKVRSQQARRRRWRRIAKVMAGLPIGLGLGFGIWYGGNWTVDQLVYHNRVFEIENIDVGTDGVLASRHVRGWARVRVGDNLLGLNLARVKRDLELVPWIREAVVERVFPGTLKIEITERMPLARVYALQRGGDDGGVKPVMLYLDEAGWVLPPREKWLADGKEPAKARAYPTVTGFDVNLLRPGDAVDSKQVQAAVNLLTAFEASPMRRLVRIRNIDLTSDDVLTVTTDGGSRVIFPDDGFRHEMMRWYAIHNAGQDLGRTLAFLDLSVGKNLPARWQPVPEPPQDQGRSNGEESNV